MSDELSGKVGFNQGEQAGQPAQTGSASTQEQVKSTEPQYITRDEFSKQLDEIKRFSQGLVDKNVSRLDKRVSDATSRVNQLIEMGKKTGLQFTPEQEAKMRSVAIDEALAQQDTQQVSASQEQASPAQAGVVTGEQRHPAEVWAVNLISAAGMPENAPEIAMINTATSSEAEYRKSVVAAVSAYTDRISRPAGSPASMPSFSAKGAGGGSLEQQYVQEIMAARGKGQNAGRSIRQKYRSQGVDVDNIVIPIP